MEGIESLANPAPRLIPPDGLACTCKHREPGYCIAHPAPARTSFVPSRWMRRELDVLIEVSAEALPKADDFPPNQANAEPHGKVHQAD
jgi:hypothetical protein